MPRWAALPWPAGRPCARVPSKLGDLPAHIARAQGEVRDRVDVPWWGLWVAFPGSSRGFLFLLCFPHLSVHRSVGLRPSVGVALRGRSRSKKSLHFQSDSIHGAKLQKHVLELKRRT